MANKLRTLYAIDLNGSPLNQFSGNELEIFEDTDHKVNVAIDGEILTGAILKNLKEGGSSKISDVVVNGNSVVENKVASIELKTINDESITGTGDLKLFDTDYNFFGYVYGKLFTIIRVHVTSSGSNYYFERYQLANEKITWLGLDEAFNFLRERGVEIPVVKDDLSFTEALNIVCAVDSEIFKQLILLLLNDEPYVFNRTWSDGVNIYTVFNNIDAGQVYVDAQGNHSLISLLTSLDEITDIAGHVNP